MGSAKRTLFLGKRMGNSGRLPPAAPCPPSLEIAPLMGNRKRQTGVKAPSSGIRHALAPARPRRTAGDKEANP